MLLKKWFVCDILNISYKREEIMIKDKPKEIVTERLCLRSIFDEDCEALCRLLTSEIVAKTYILPGFKSRDE